MANRSRIVAEFLGVKCVCADEVCEPVLIAAELSGVEWRGGVEGGVEGAWRGRGRVHDE